MSRQIAQPLGHYELATDEALALSAKGQISFGRLEVVYVFSVLLRVGTSRCDVPARVQRAERQALHQPSFRA